jgi:serine/threonine protein kinase
MRKELTMWGRMNHKNVVKIFRLYESNKEDKMYVLMQYADMG